jgi:cytidylate kinase
MFPERPGPVRKISLKLTEVITIDGPAGSGKSTVARLLARKLGFLYLDTGAMYRAVALAAREQGLDTGDPAGLGTLCSSLPLSFKGDEDPPRVYLAEKDITTAIRSPEMDLLSSSISAVREVRTAMKELQRAMAQGADIVAEGRDMGTVVFSDARHKFFLTASPEVRAARRYRERTERGESVSMDVVEAEIRKRDHQDQTRVLAPLKPARDAEVIDTSDLTPEGVLEGILGSL